MSAARAAYLVSGVRTPIGRYGGALAGIRPDDLAAHVIRELTGRHPNVDWANVDEVVLGCANQAGEDNRNVARMSALLAGLPVDVPGVTLNRLCASWPRCGGLRRPHDHRWRRRPDHRRRRREHEPRAVRAAKGADAVFALGGDL